MKDIASVANKDTIAVEHLADLKSRYEQSTAAHYGVKEGVNVKDLSSAGWGVIFAAADQQHTAAWKQALQPLLALRREQAGKLYREFVGDDAIRPDESKNKFLARHGVGPGPADPAKVPYYLLLVADPKSISYRFQYQLDVQYAVGRIHFDTPEDYASYAQSVVNAETGLVQRTRQAVFFGVANPDDAATALSAQHLVVPVADKLAQDLPSWQIRKILSDQATKSALAQIYSDNTKPAFLFTASHGLGFPKGHPLQLSHQGALLCQDWPGVRAWSGKAIPPDFYFSADDVPDEADFSGLIGFHFACYGAGTPQTDDFAYSAFRERVDLAAQPFISGLAKRLLCHAAGGALAYIGHVERAWTYSFQWPQAGSQLTVFESAIKRLLDSYPVGAAMEYFNERYAELSTMLSDEQEQIHFGKRPDEVELAGMWTANNDAKNYVIVGDPAVRLPLS